MKKLLSVLLVLALIILPLAAVVTAGAAVMTSWVVVKTMNDDKTTGPVQPDPTNSQPVVTDPVVTDPVVTDPVVTDPVVTDPVVTDPVVTDPVVTDPTTPTKPGETTKPTVAATPKPTTAATTSAQPTGGLAAPANLNTLAQAAQLDYFNKVAQNVRDKKPGFTRIETLIIEKVNVDGLGVFGSVVNPIVNMVKNQLMDGKPTERVYPKNGDNKGEFLSENAKASGLTTADITGITSTKSGDGWKIEVKIKTEKDPAKGAGSANSRIYVISSKKEVFDEITGISDMIEAPLDKASLEYHSGYAWVIVNAQGQVTSAQTGFQVKAVANDVKISVAKNLTVNAPQNTTRVYKDFKW